MSQLVKASAATGSIQYGWGVTRSDEGEATEQVPSRRIADALRDFISSGALAEGDKLPSERELARRYGIARNTAREAVRILTDEGLVTAEHGRGVFVRPRPPMKRLGVERYARSKWKAGLVAFAADREASGRDWKPTDQTQTVRLIPADRETADALEIQPGSLVYERARVVKESDRPTHTLTSYYRPEHVEGTAIVNPTPGPAGQGGGFQVLTLQGFEPHHIRETFFARMPTRDELALLALPQGEPVMVLRRTTFTVDGVPVESAVGVHAASRFAWTYEFVIPD